MISLQPSQVSIDCKSLSQSPAVTICTILQSLKVACFDYMLYLYFLDSQNKRSLLS